MAGDKFKSVFHKDGTVTLWNVYLQQWQRVAPELITDRVLASLPTRERLRILKKREKTETEQVLILRKPCFPEDEGRYFPIKRCSRKEAKEWITAQRDEYYRPGDYQIAELN